MPIPGRPHTFALENCRGVLDKLDREIERLHAAAHNDVAAHNDAAFNAAVTAWHLCDWVFADMTPAQRDKLNIQTVSAMQEYARNHCRALYLCRQVATASKHWRVEQHPDHKVKVFVTVLSSLPAVRLPRNLHFAPGCYLYFDDDGQVQPAEDVFSAAVDFWTQFIYGNEIAK